MSELRLPAKGGNGPLIVEALDKDLAYWGKRLTESLLAGDSRNPQLDTQRRDAIFAEQDRRAKGGRPAAPSQAQQQSTAIARVNVADIIGTFTQAGELNERLAKAAESVNLISPATSVGHLPMGIAISISVVPVNIESDTYQLQGKFGLSKHVLNKIAMQLGISWDTNASGRLDDGSDSRYCRYIAAGTYLGLDGREMTVSAEKELDLRPGSPQIDALQEQQAGKVDNDGKRKTADAMVRELRLHIQSHAETKAKNRCIRTFGVKTAYTREELLKPFVAVRPLFTGQAEDPEVRRLFAERIADQFLGSRRALYGGAPSLPAPRAIQRRPPPPSHGGLDDDDAIDAHDSDDGYPFEDDEHNAEGLVY